MDKNINLEEQMENQEKKDKKKQQKGSKSGLFDWAEALVLSLGVLMLVLLFCFRIIAVDGSSMYPTLYDHDRIVIGNLFYTPQKGDIVVLTKKSFLPEPIVKRVIATEGDTIDINFATYEVTVNGEVLQEDYINPEREEMMRTGDMEFPQTVPKGCIFVMGDNRDHSTDSRASELGMVDERYVQGKVLYRIAPFSAFGKIE